MVVVYIILYSRFIFCCEGTFMDATGQDNKISGEDYVEIDEETLRLLK